MIQLCILLSVTLLFIIVIYFTTCYSKDSYYNISPIRGSRYDPEIVEKSGGMAGFSTFPYDTSPYGGYVNFPYYTPFYYNSFPLSYECSHCDYDYPYYGYNYDYEPVGYGAHYDYLPESLYSRIDYDIPFHLR